MRLPASTKHVFLPGPLLGQTSFLSIVPVLESAAMAAPTKNSVTATIEREVKLYVPLSGWLRRLLTNSCQHTEIRLSYFKPKQNKNVIAATIRNLSQLVVDDNAFSISELRRAQVKRSAAGSTPKFWIAISRLLQGAAGPVLSTVDVPIKRSIFKKISREYNPERRCAMIFEKCGPVIIDGERFGAEDFASARVRHVRSSAGNQYFVDLKGKRHGSHRINRAELSVPISAAEYSRLLDEADGGTVVKTRYSEDGLLRLPSRMAISIRAEIDILRALGPECTPMHRMAKVSGAAELPEFALVEIELPRGVSRNAVLKAVRAGSHTLGVLAGPAINLSFKSKDGSDALGMRRLAALGIDEPAYTVLAMLAARCEQIVKKQPQRKTKIAV